MGFELRFFCDRTNVNSSLDRRKLYARREEIFYSTTLKAAKFQINNRANGVFQFQLKAYILSMWRLKG